MFEMSYQNNRPLINRKKKILPNFGHTKKISTDMTNKSCRFVGFGTASKVRAAIIPDQVN